MKKKSVIRLMLSSYGYIESYINHIKVIEMNKNKPTMFLVNKNYINTSYCFNDKYLHAFDRIYEKVYNYKIRRL